jgi:membrane protease subunit (stomatin/prohibitin family)
MGLWDRIKGEFVDVIEWTDGTDDLMVYRFERRGNEIKYGAKLTVRESQVAVFINEGQLADTFAPGMYTLETANLPILSTLQGWKYGFESPFKAEIYFVNTKRFRDLKWGTKNPVTLRDKEFGPVRLRAFGTYEIRVKDPPTFLRQIVGTDGYFTTDEISDQLRNITVSRFADVLASSGIPVLDLAANYDDLSGFLTGKIAPEFEQYGLELTKLLVENVSLPPAVEEALDKRTSMGVIGDLSKYTQFQTAEAITKAAENPGAGPAAAGVGLGAGMAMAQQMANSMNQQQTPQQSSPQPAAPQRSPGAAPPPLPGARTWYVAADGQRQGPLPVDQLRQQAQAGTLTRDTLVWCEGMANWEKAGEVEELSELFASVPPPLPPAG